MTPALTPASCGGVALVARQARRPAAPARAPRAGVMRSGGGPASRTPTRIALRRRDARPCAAPCAAPCRAGSACSPRPSRRSCAAPAAAAARRACCSTSLRRLSSRGLGVGFVGPDDARCIRAVPSGTRDEIAGRELHAGRHAIGIGLVERDRHQHVDDALCHGTVGRRIRGQLTEGCKQGRGADYQAVPHVLSTAPMNEPTDNALTDLAFAAPDVRGELVALARPILAAERRMSPKTVEAYGRDARQFLAFLAEHLGGRVTLAGSRELTPADVRAFMAARRGDGIGGRSLMRGARRRALVRPLSRTRGQGQGRRACRRARAEDRQDSAEAAGRRAAKQLTDADLRAGEEREPMGAGARRRRAGAALRLGPAHLRGARPQAQRHARRPAAATPSRSPARATRPAWCRCCRRC